MREEAITQIQKSMERQKSIMKNLPALLQEMEDATKIGNWL